MNENLIFEGNTIYELDPVCIKNKKMQKETAKRMDCRERNGRMKKYSATDGCPDQTLQMIKLWFLIELFAGWR